MVRAVCDSVVYGSILARTHPLLAAGPLDPDFVMPKTTSSYAAPWTRWFLPACKRCSCASACMTPKCRGAFSASRPQLARALQRFIGVSWEMAEAIYRPESVTNARVGLQVIDWLVERERDYLQQAALSPAEESQIRAATSFCIRRLTRAGVTASSALSYLWRWSRRDGLEVPGRLLSYAFKRHRGRTRRIPAIPP